MANKCASNESGQAAVFLTLLLMFVFIGLAAVAIDGGHLYLVRRDLQNMADAAALAGAIELSRGGTSTDAENQAAASILSNGGISDYYLPKDGTGVNMVRGIEVVSLTVRVALQKTTNTFFGPFIGRSSVVVGARAQAVGNAAGGIMPIAVKRFSCGDPYQKFSVAQEDCAPHGQPSADIYDYLRPQGSDVLSGWPDLYVSPTPSASETAKGREYDASKQNFWQPILGQEARANVASGSDFRFFICLDVRDLTSNPHTYYMGVDAGTNAPTLKNLESQWIRQLGYPGPIPTIGQEIAVLPGTDAAMAAKTMADVKYSLEQPIAVVVYDGVVYRSEDFHFDAKQSEWYKASPNLSTQSATYTIYIVPERNFHRSVTLKVLGLDGWADWNFGSGLNTPHTISVDYPTTSQVTLVISQSSPVARVGSFSVEATVPSPGPDRLHYWYGVVNAGQPVWPTPKPPNDPYVPDASIIPTADRPAVQAGKKTQVGLVFKSYNGSGGWNYDITYSFTGQPGCVTMNPGSISISGSHKSKTAKIDVDATACQDSDAKRYVITATATVMASKGQQSYGPFTHNAYFALDVEPSAPGYTAGGMDKYVRVLGYALYRIIGYTPTADNPNTVYGYAVSGLLTNTEVAEKLAKGMNPRLVQWK